MPCHRHWKSKQPNSKKTKPLRIFLRSGFIFFLG